MKKNILITSLLSIFLILMVPNITAVEYKTVEQINTNNVDIDELKNAIILRIEKLKEKKYKLSIFGLNWTDPDGPLEGGLDDVADIISLICGIISGGILLYAIRNKALRNSENLFLFVLWIFNYGLATYNTILGFAEAFDVYEDPPGDVL